jgi:hypothetical protein
MYNTDKHKRLACNSNKALLRIHNTVHNTSTYMFRTSALSQKLTLV